MNQQKKRKMEKAKEKIEEIPEGLRLLLKWIFLIMGVPTLGYIFLSTSVQYTFEIATIGWQIFVGVILIIILVMYIYFSIKYLIKETKEYLS